MKVQSQGSASDFSPGIVVRLRINPDGTVVVEIAPADGHT